MTFSTSEQAAAPRRRPRLDSRVTERLVIGLSLTPAFIITLIGTFIFLGWTVLMSMTDSTLFPSTDFVGLEGYWQIWKYPRWQVAAGNLFTFGPIYMLVCGVIGIGMAIAIDQNVRGENIFRAIYLYPMAVSFVVAGTIWRRAPRHRRPNRDRGRGDGRRTPTRPARRGARAAPLQVPCRNSPASNVAWPMS